MRHPSLLDVLIGVYRRTGEREERTIPNPPVLPFSCKWLALAEAIARIGARRVMGVVEDGSHALERFHEL